MDIISKAINFAAVKHNSQVRKGTDIPYIVHPFQVGLILIKAGCSDDVVAAGILHDTMEDARVKYEELEMEFNKNIADIVKACSEPDKKKTWEERKEHTIDFLKTASRDVKIVSCADKLHNISSIYDNWIKVGDSVWLRFKRGKKEQEWYYKELIESLKCSDFNDKQNKVYDEYVAMVYKVFGK